MESLSRYLSISPPFLNPSKPLKPTSKSHILFSNYIPTSPNPSSSPQSITGTQGPRTTLSSHNLLKDSFFLKPHLSFPFLGFSFPFPSLASELTSLPTEEASNKINLESILVSIDNFFNRYPFFVATVTFIWLVVIPLTEEYLQKYKFISAINAFKKLQDDPTCQLLDIRDSRSLGALDSPNLKLLNKSTVQVEFREDDEEGFVKRAVENFGEPADTILCIVDNFDGNSLKAAELLVKNGFKEAYAIRGGLRGEKGWQIKFH